MMTAFSTFYTLEGYYFHTHSLTFQLQITFSFSSSGFVLQSNGHSALKEGCLYRGIVIGFEEMQTRNKIQRGKRLISNAMTSIPKLLTQRVAISSASNHCEHFRKGSPVTNGL